MFFHVQDGKWSWIVCASATICWLVPMGFVFSFGVFLPVFMDYFRESREKTGKYNAEALLVRKYPSNLKVEVKA